MALERDSDVSEREDGGNDDDADDHDDDAGARRRRRPPPTFKTRRSFRPAKTIRVTGEVDGGLAEEAVPVSGLG